MGWFKRWYGANPLHLLALIGCLALTWYAGARLLHAKPVDVFIWFAGAVVGHDLILLPLYALADKSVTTVFRHRPPKLPTVPWINYLRVPVVLSGLLLLLWFPLIFKIPSRFPSYTDLSLDPYLGHWLAVTGALFLLSAVALAARLRPGRQPVVPYRPDADADADFDPGPAVHHPAAYDGTAYDGTTYDGTAYDGTAAYDDPFGPPQRPSYGTDDPFGPPQRLYDTQDQRSWEGPPPAAPSRGPGPGRHRQAAGDSQWQQGARQRQRPGNAPQRPGEGRPRPDEDPRQWRGDPRQRPGEGRPPWPDDARQRQGGARPRPQEDPRQWRDDPRQRPGEGRPPWPDDDRQWPEDARPWPEEDPRQWRTDPRQRPGDR